jgi:hypothetical protein
MLYLGSVGEKGRVSLSCPIQGAMARRQLAGLLTVVGLVKDTGHARDSRRNAGRLLHIEDGPSALLLNNVAIVAYAFR